MVEMIDICCRVRVISILLERSDSTKMDLLMVCDKPLGYDLLVGINATCELGLIVIRPTGEVQLRRKRELCTAIMIEGQYFCAVFDHKKKVWTVKWKWIRNKVPDQLHNTVEEYMVSNKSRAAYATELETWIMNDWLIL